jgi:hypothetical protein
VKTNKSVGLHYSLHTLSSTHASRLTQAGLDDDPAREPSRAASGCCFAPRPSGRLRDFFRSSLTGKSDTQRLPLDRSLPPRPSLAFVLGKAGSLGRS